MSHIESAWLIHNRLIDKMKTEISDLRLELFEAQVRVERYTLMYDDMIHDVKKLTDKIGELLDTIPQLSK